LLSSSRLFEQSELFFHRQLVPGFSGDNPDTVDCRLKLNFAAGPNVMGIGNRFGQGYLKFTCYSAHVPYSSKDNFLVKGRNSTTKVQWLSLMPTVIH
jgi:hypothetical protein